MATDLTWLSPATVDVPFTATPPVTARTAVTVTVEPMGAFWLVAAFWDTHRMLVMGLLTGGFLAAGLIALRALPDLRRRAQFVLTTAAASIAPMPWASQNSLTLPETKSSGLPRALLTTSISANP